jgi:hypothetical protein
MKRTPESLGLLGGLLVVFFLGARFLGSPMPVWTLSLGVLGVFLLSAYLLLDRPALQKRQPHVVSALASSVFLVALGGLVVLLFNVWVGRQAWQWDASVQGKYTLTSHSKEVANAIETDIEVVGFFPEGSVEERSFVDLFGLFSRQSDRLDLRVVDPLASPMEFDAVREWVGLEQLGTLQVLLLTRNSEGAVHQSVVLDAPFLEEDFVLGIKRVQVQEKPLICFSQGHGERDLGERGNLVDYGGIHERMLGANYQVGLVGPLQRIPDRCAALVVAGPETSLHSVTQEQIAAYVKAGGALVVLLEPVLPGAEPSVPMDLQRYGFEIGLDLVVESHPDRILADRDISHVVVDMSSFDFHPIVNGMDRSTVFQGARSVGVGDKVPGIQVQALAFTTEMGWSERDAASMVGEQDAEKDTDEPSRVSLMAIAEVMDSKSVEVGSTQLEGSSPVFEVRQLEAGESVPGVLTGHNGRLARGKVVVFGDADFISNRLVLGGVNHDLFLNTLSWLVDEEAPRGERSLDASKGLMILSDSDSRTLWRMSVVLGPGVALFLAMLAWWRRREG